MEMAATDEMLFFALEIGPESICIVPENREEVTTEGGLDVAGNRARVKSIVDAASRAGIATSLFIDPDTDQIAASANTGASHIELHTGATLTPTIRKADPSSSIALFVEPKREMNGV